ncbi:MAG: tetratricopeptide repeat protein [Terriglobales bacterium]
MLEYESMLNAPGLEADEKATLLHSISVCRYRIGDLAGAREAIGVSKTLTRDQDLRLYIELQEGVLLSRNDESDAALAKFKSLLANPAVNRLPEMRSSIQINLSQLLLKLGRDTEALPVLRDLYDTGIGAADYAYLIGNCLLKQGNLEQSERMFAEAAEAGSDPSIRLQARYQLGRTYARMGHFARAKEQLRICEEHIADSGIPSDWLFHTLADVSADLGDDLEAQRYRRLANRV